MDKSRKKPQKKNSTVKLFVLFASVALVTVVLLEYIDFRKGEKSFIFTRLIQLEKRKEKVDLFNRKFESILNTNRIPFDYFSDNEGKYHFRVDVEDAYFEPLMDKVKTLIGQVGASLELVEIQGLGKKSVMLYRVKSRNKITHLLLITRIKPGAEIREKEKPEITFPKVKEKETEAVRIAPVEEKGTPPRIAIIIDDMGAYEFGPLELKRLGVPVTASVLFDSSRAEEVVRKLREYDIEMIIHLPMQPTNSNGKVYNPSEVITVNSTDQQIRSLIRKAREIVPMAEGLNNHEGSRVTADLPTMEKVMRVIKDEGLFFVDSRTTAQTVAYNVAREMGIHAAHKDVFLDHVQTYSHSIEQIRILVDLAIKNGKSIAIGHPFASTFQAIMDSRQYIEARGVKVVLVKELLD